MTILSMSIAAVWAAGFWAMSKESSDTRTVALVGAGAGVVFVGLAASQIWPQMAAGYPLDSYWTLDWFGRGGVALISTLGLLVLFLALHQKTRLILRIKRQASSTAWLIVDIAVGMFVFAVLFSVAPQVFYSFYRMIIPTLPNQWVIDGWLDPERLEMIAKLDATGSLADHLAGVVLWAIVPFTAWLHLRFWWRCGA